VGWEFVSKCIKGHLHAASLRVFNGMLARTRRQVEDHGMATYADGVVVTRANATLVSRLGVAKDVFAQHPSAVHDAFADTVAQCRYKTASVSTSTAAAKRRWLRFSQGRKCVTAGDVRREYCTLLASAQQEARAADAEGAGAVHANSDAVMACVSRGLTALVPAVVSALHSQRNPFASGGDLSHVWTADSAVTSPSLRAAMMQGQLTSPAPADDEDVCIDYCHWQSANGVVEAAAQWALAQCRARVQHDGVVAWGSFAPAGHAELEASHVEHRFAGLMRDLRRDRQRFLDDEDHAHAHPALRALYSRPDFPVLADCVEAQLPHTARRSLHALAAATDDAHDAEDEEGLSVSLGAVKQHPYALHGALAAAFSKCALDRRDGMGSLWRFYAHQSLPPLDHIPDAAAAAKDKSDSMLTRARLAELLERVMRQSHVASLVATSPLLSSAVAKQAAGHHRVRVRDLLAQDRFRKLESVWGHKAGVKVFQTCVKHTIPSAVNALVAFYRSRSPSTDVRDTVHWEALAPNNRLSSLPLITADIITYNSSVALSSAQRYHLDGITYGEWARRQMSHVRVSATPLQPWGMCPAPSAYRAAHGGQKHTVDALGSALLSLARGIADECNSYVHWEHALARLHIELRDSADAQGIARALYGDHPRKRVRRHTRDTGAGAETGGAEVDDEMYSERELLRARDHVTYVLSRGGGHQRAARTLYEVMLRHINNADEVRSSADLMAMHSLLQFEDPSLHDAHVEQPAHALQADIDACLQAQLPHAPTPPACEGPEAGRAVCVRAAGLTMFQWVRAATARCTSKFAKHKRLATAPAKFVASNSDVAAQLVDVPAAQLPRGLATVSDEAHWAGVNALQTLAEDAAAGASDAWLSPAQARALLGADDEADTPAEVMFLQTGASEAPAAGADSGGAAANADEARGAWNRVVDNDRGVLVSLISRRLGESLSAFTTRSLNAALPAAVTKATNNTVVRLTVERTLAQMTLTLTDSLTKGTLKGMGQHTSVLMTQALTNILVPGITFPATSVIARALTHNPRQDYYCYYCKHNERYCEYCQRALQYNDYVDHVAQYFNQYYTQYYTPFYTRDAHVRQYGHLANKVFDGIVEGVVVAAEEEAAQAEGEEEAAEAEQG
jgi:hypothetical protein